MAMLAGVSPATDRAAEPAIDPDAPEGFRRHTMSADVRDALLTFATGDPARSLASTDHDWPAVLPAVYRNGLIGLANLYLQHGVSRDAVPPWFRSEIEVANLVQTLHQRDLYVWIADVVSVLQWSGIRSLVLKGPAIAHLVYPDPALRSFGDLDLMIRERDMPAAHRLLLRLGFECEVHLPVAPAKLTRWCTTYERVYADADSDRVLELHGDDLLNAGLRSRDLAGYWDRAQRVSLAGMHAETLALEDHLVHLCCHLHYHGVTRLNWIADLAFLVRDHGERIDWDAVARVVDVEDASVPVSSSLRYLGALCGVHAPSSFMRSIQPGAVRRRVHQHFLPEERVLDLAPMPRPDFSFYHQPVFKRLVPDLLTMGRTREKACYLARLVVPPPDWLEEYYAVRHRRLLPFHYVLHPLKLVIHLGREMATLRQRRGPWWDTAR
jgi:hypothetical protein